MTDIQWGYCVVWMLNISVPINDQTKAHSEKKINCCENPFLYQQWFPNDVLVRTKTHTKTHTYTLIPFSLFTLHHHANPACFTQQETEKLIVIPQGSADLSQICLSHAPHSTSFLYVLAPRNLKILHLWDLLEMWEVCEWSLSWGIPFLSCGTIWRENWAKMERETERGRLYSAVSSSGLQSCSNIERKCLGKLGWVFAWMLYVTEDSSWLSPWRKHVSLLERPDLINKWCPVSSSLSHRMRSCLELSWKMVPNTILCLFSPPPSDDIGVFSKLVLLDFLDCF